MTPRRREAIEMLLAALLGLLLAAVAAVARGQTCGPGGCPMPGRGVGVGVGIGMGMGAWGQPRAPREEPAPSQSPPPQAVRIANRTEREICYGSGALVRFAERSLVITCRHLFTDGVGTITVAFPSGQPQAAQLLGMDSTADLAALAIAETGVQPLAIATDPPLRGHTLWGGGFGSPVEQWRWVSGTCRGYVRLDRNSQSATTFTIPGPARDGDSGGPVVNTRGELAGVIWGTDDPRERNRETYATYSGKVLSFLTRAVGQPSANPVPGTAAPSTPNPNAVTPPAATPSTAIPPALQERLDELRQSINDQAGARAGQSEAITAINERLGDLAGKIAEGGAASVATAVLTGLGWTGPPAAVIAALPWLVALLRRRRQRTQSGSTGRTSPAVTTQPSGPSTTDTCGDNKFVPTPAQQDYVSYWADHFAKTGGNLAEEAAKAPLYVEALDLLTDGKFAVPATASAIASGVEDYVHQQFTSGGGILPQCDLEEAAYVGFLYRDGLTRIRTGLLKASGYREAATVIHGHVARQFLLRVHRVPNVNFLPGDRS